MTQVISLFWDGTWLWLWDFDHTSIIVWVMSITRVIVGQTCVLLMDLECNTWEWLWNGSLSWWWIQIIHISYWYITNHHGQLWDKKQYLVHTSSIMCGVLLSVNLQWSYKNETFHYLLYFVQKQVFLTIKHNNKLESTRCCHPHIKLNGGGPASISPAHH
jgi:hypothetical protein